MRDLKVELKALDGYPLVARQYLVDDALAVAVVAGATGVPQRAYRRFAEALGAHRLSVLTVDFRGIGDSAPRSLRGFEASFTSWAQLDLPAAVDLAHRLGPVAVVGHSFGGHAFGQLPAPNRTLGLYTFGTGVAWSGHMTRGERLKVEAMWNLLGPPVTGSFGYLPGKIWGGASLPLGVYREWKRWSRTANYFFDHPALGMQALFDRVTVPVVGVTASDDPWAPLPSMRSFLSHYRHAPLELLVDSPQEHGVTAIGHLGHFKPPLVQTVAARVAAWVTRRAHETASMQRAAPVPTQEARYERSAG